MRFIDHDILFATSMKLLRHNLGVTVSLNDIVIILITLSQVTLAVH